MHSVFRVGADFSPSPLRFSIPGFYFLLPLFFPNSNFCLPVSPLPTIHYSLSSPFPPSSFPLDSCRAHLVGSVLRFRRPLSIYDLLAIARGGFRWEKSTYHASFSGVFSL